MLQLWHLGFPVQHTLTSNKACHTQHAQNHETIQEKVNSQLCQCCRTGSKSNSDCAWTANLLGEKMGGFEYNIHILSRRMFFSSSALDVDEFTSVHISVCGNMLQMNTHSRLFQKPLLLKDVFLISASLIYSLQVRSVTVLCVCVIGFFSPWHNLINPWYLLCFRKVFVASVSGRVTQHNLAVQPVWISLTVPPISIFNRIEVKTYIEAEND